MPDVIEQLRRYGEAVERHALHDAADPIAERAVAERPARRRRSVVALAAAAALLVGLIVVVLARDDSSGPRSVHVAPRQQAPAPVPAGWKPVTFGPVQFAVPQEWPVYDDGRCFDETVDAVYLNALAGIGSSGCSGSFKAVQVQVNAYVGGDTGIDGATPKQLNGLRALVREPGPITGGSGMYTVALPDEQVIIGIWFFADADLPIVRQIGETVGPAPFSAPIPTVPFREPTPATAKPGPSEFCAAVEDFRSAGLVDAATGAIKVEALPYMERIRAAAPAEIQGPVEVIIRWLQLGAPLPKPAELIEAESQSTQDWVRRC
jgi:hypothetical protein